MDSGSHRAPKSYKYRLSEMALSGCQKVFSKMFFQAPKGPYQVLRALEGLSGSRECRRSGSQRALAFSDAHGPFKEALERAMLNLKFHRTP